MEQRTLSGVDWLLKAIELNVTKWTKKPQRKPLIWCKNNLQTGEFLMRSSLTVAISQFCQREKIKRTRSSPHHPQSNGKSESAIKIVKTALRKSGKTALNSYKNITGPAQYTHGRNDNISLRAILKVVNKNWNTYESNSPHPGTYWTSFGGKSIENQEISCLLW